MEFTAIEFRGDTDLVIGDFSRGTLLSTLQIEYPPFYKFWRSDPVFNAADIPKFQETLRIYADSLGYYRADINSTIEEQTLVYTIKKNSPLLVDTIEIDDEYRAIIPLKEGEIFTTAKFKASKSKIKRYLNESAHPKFLFGAKATVDTDLYKADAIFHVEKKEVCFIGATTIEGNGAIDKEIIEEQIRYKEGEAFNIINIEETYQNIYNLSIYGYILVEPLLEQNSTTVPIHIKLQEGKTKEIKFGAGFSTDDGIRGSAGWKSRNFFGNLKTMEVILRGSERGFELENRFTDPLVTLPLAGRVVFENSLKLSDLSYESYDEQKLEDIISFRKDLWHIRHTLGLMFEYSLVDSKIEGDHTDGNYLLNSWFYKGLVDKRDSLLDAKNGYLLSFYSEKSAPWLWSDMDYLKMIAEGRYLITYSDFTTAVKAKIGTVSEEVPIFKRFFAGGAFSNRGYQYEKFGETDAKGTPYGGLTLIDSAIEARYALMNDFSMVLFWDSTMLHNEIYNFSGELSHSYGIGMRYSTPIGPLRVDVGRPTEVADYVFHFGIGQTF
ncbi:MAG: hypothetical protein DRG24_01040 [Epsilonproteobacteria bacterium]|nr:MAG: hypothetical protein DRG24_01040 [Campylobacterota bacterium]